ncbi:MAG: hypothetical protein AAB518_02330 [Patescibacteria group bacterium]
MNAWIVAGSAIGLLAFVPLAKQIIRGEIRQNFATWILWTAMDGTAAVTIIAQKGNFLLPAGYSLACFVTALLILRSKTFAWTKFETMVTFLVTICLVVWYFSGAWMATIASTAAMLIAGVPQLLETYRKPWDSPFTVYAMFTIAPIFSMLGGRGWTIEERLYPGALFGYSALIVFFTVRKFWRTKPTQP